MPLKIAIYAIAKNEAKHVERFCMSARDADLVLIADTGSTDDTVSLAKQYGATVYEIGVTPWRFDVARSAALSLVPSHYDVCIGIDLDEVMTPGWRDEVERLFQNGVTRVSHRFDCGGGYVIRQDRIHARNGYVWKGICHEHLEPFRIQEQYATTDFILATHLPDNTKSRGQYLDLLFASAIDNPQDHRASFYYARELFFHGQYEHARTEFGRFLNLPSAKWNKERCYALRTMARCSQKLGDAAGAIEYAKKAIREDPQAREPWLELASQAADQGLWAECLAAAQNCLAINQQDDCFVNDPEAWTSKPNDLASIAMEHLGIKQAAIA